MCECVSVRVGVGTCLHLKLIEFGYLVEPGDKSATLIVS